MLTKKQIQSLPVGTYKNSDLAKRFPGNHGLKSREVMLPVDHKTGNVIQNISQALKTGQKFSMVGMRLGRKMAKQYGKS